MHSWLFHHTTRRLIKQRTTSSSTADMMKSQVKLKLFERTEKLRACIYQRWGNVTTRRMCFVIKAAIWVAANTEVFHYVNAAQANRSRCVMSSSTFLQMCTSVIENKVLQAKPAKNVICGLPNKITEFKFQD